MASAFPSVRPNLMRIGCSGPDFRTEQPRLYPVLGIFIGTHSGQIQQLYCRWQEATPPGLSFFSRRKVVNASIAEDEGMCLLPEHEEHLSYS